jgi:hypothetical protein
MFAAATSQTVADSLIRKVLNKRRLSLKALLCRNERPGLVASLEQYTMVYDLLQHHLIKGTTNR